MGKSLNWYLRRHPILFKIRYKLVSKKVAITQIENYCYNAINQKQDIPSLFFEVNHTIFGKKHKQRTDIEKAQKIAKWLKNNIPGGPGLGKSSFKALQKMLNSEGGVCSDLAQVFNNFCVINDLKVKEWGLKIETDNKNLSGGHSFNEIYSNELNKWILIDVAKSILFYTKTQNNPLSVLELMYSKQRNQEIHFNTFNKKKPLDEQRVRDLYCHASSSPFLITHYNNKIYDIFLDTFGFLPESIIHALVYLTGNSYRYEFPITINNQAENSKNKNC